jgi:hypothetical protein
MDVIRHVKKRLFTTLLALAAGGLLAADPPPDPQEILRAVRFSQASQHESLKGQLRTGPKIVAFRLSISGPVIQYEFTDPPPSTIVVRLGEKDSKISEGPKGGAERVSGAHFSDLVRGSDISYEDLSLRFLYWQRAQLEGEQTMLLRRCWVVNVEPPAGSDSQYSKVGLWIDQESGGLLQAEAYDRAGKFSRRFKVISGQKIGGAWYLKQMRIEAPALPGKSKTPTYLEVSADKP